MASAFTSWRSNTHSDSANNPISTQDANGNYLTTVYASNSERPAAKVDPLNLRTSQVFDLAGQNTGRQNAANSWITMVYDLAGRQEAIFNEIGYGTTTSYDLDGRAVSIIDGTSRVKTMVYDAASNQIQTKYSDATILTLQYDPLNRVTTMADWGGYTTYAFDPRSLLIGKTDPGALVQAYSYDQIASRTLLVDPDNGRFTTVYDSLNRAFVLSNPDGQVYTAQYDPNGRNTTLLAGSSGQTLRSFDAAGRVITLVEATSGGSSIVTVVDSYDPAGRKVVSTRQGVPTSYSYDNADRLTGQTVVNGVATFVNDSIGNVQVKWYQGNPPQTMTFDPASRTVTMLYGAAQTLYTFDQAGNTTAENQGGAVTGYVYDCENRQTKMTNPMFQVTTWTWGGDGLKRGWQQPGQPIYNMVWDGANYLGEVQ